MYKTVEGNKRMTANDACVEYPNNYILMQLENDDTFDPVGLVLYIGDDGDELFSLQVNLPVPMGIVIEGLNYRRSLGGLVVGE